MTETISIVCYATSHELSGLSIDREGGRRPLLPTAGGVWLQYLAIGKEVDYVMELNSYFSFSGWCLELPGT